MDVVRNECFIIRNDAESCASCGMYNGDYFNEEEKRLLMRFHRSIFSLPDEDLEDIYDAIKLQERSLDIILVLMLNRTQALHFVYNQFDWAENVVRMSRHLQYIDAFIPGQDNFIPGYVSVTILEAALQRNIDDDHCGIVIDNLIERLFRGTQIGFSFREWLICQYRCFYNSDGPEGGNALRRRVQFLWRGLRRYMEDRDAELLFQQATTRDEIVYTNMFFLSTIGIFKRILETRTPTSIQNFMLELSKIEEEKIMKYNDACLAFIMIKDGFTFPTDRDYSKTIEIILNRIRLRDIGGQAIRLFSDAEREVPQFYTLLAKKISNGSIQISSLPTDIRNTIEDYKKICEFWKKFIG